MALGTLSENERRCLEADAKNQSNRSDDNGECKPNGLRVRFMDEEGKTERTVSADEPDCAARLSKIHILKNRSASETSILLRNPSLAKRRTGAGAERRYSLGGSDTLNNNTASSENLNGRNLFTDDNRQDKDEAEQTKDANGHSFKKNCNVYSVNQAKTLTAERKKSIPLTMPRLIGHRAHEAGQAHGAPKSCLPGEVCLAEAAGKDFKTRTIGKLSRGLGKLLRRTNSVRISDPDPVYKVAYLGNVLTGWARGESCIEKPLATLWRNYQQSTKPDVVMKLSVTNSGLKGFTKEHGLTEYWSHRVTYCASPPHFPRMFCWVYRHEGKKLKHELRCHAVLCTKDNISKKITEELQLKLKQALVEFKKDRISKQNARLSLANSVYENPSMPRRKILLSVGSQNYRPPLERSKSAPKLGAIEELCSEEDEEEAEMNAKNDDCRSSFSENMAMDRLYASQTLDRRRPEARSPRKLSCPEGVMHRTFSDSGRDSVTVSDELLNMIVKESERDEASQEEKKLEAIAEILEEGAAESKQIYHVTDSDDGSVSSGCETASTATDPEPSSLPSLPRDQHEPDYDYRGFERQSSRSLHPGDDAEVNHVPIGENNAFRRRSTYPPLGTDAIHGYDNTFESLMSTLDADSLASSTENEVFKSSGDNDSACSDESGYSELLDTKDSIIGNTIMV